MNTASEVISFTKKLEEDSAWFYESLAERYINTRETWLSFARENRKNIVQIERAYYGVISDALEGCFSFNMSPEKYTLKTGLSENSSYADTLHQALEIEEGILRFYSDAAAQSRSLLADIPRTFNLIARKRADRKAKLQSLLNRED